MSEQGLGVTNYMIALVAELKAEVRQLEAERDALREEAEEVGDMVTHLVGRELTLREALAEIRRHLYEEPMSEAYIDGVIQAALDAAQKAQP